MLRENILPFAKEYVREVLSYMRDYGVKAPQNSDECNDLLHNTFPEFMNNNNRYRNTSWEDSDAGGYVDSDGNIKNVGDVEKWHIALQQSKEITDKRERDVANLIAAIGDTFKATQGLKLYGAWMVKHTKDILELAKRVSDGSYFRDIARPGVYNPNVGKDISSESIGKVMPYRQSQGLVPSQDPKNANLYAGNNLNLNTPRNKKLYLSKNNPERKQAAVYNQGGEVRAKNGTILYNRKNA